MTVFVTECVCANGHRLLAIGWEGTQQETRAAEKRLRVGMSLAVSARVLNPWCGLCQSRVQHYRTTQIEHATIGEALPGLLKDEAVELDLAQRAGEMDADTVKEWYKARRERAN